MTTGTDTIGCREPRTDDPQQECAAACLPSTDRCPAQEVVADLDADGDGCHSRNEVLLQEAVEPPLAGERCRLAGGRWHSYYDDALVSGPAGLDVDHVVPLAESWDSGAYAWDSRRRQDYANDLDDPRALVAVSARSNRQKADQDPAQWLPPHGPAVCRYLGEWTAIKLRWNLKADAGEKTALARRAEDCPDDPLTITPAPGGR